MMTLHILTVVVLLGCILHTTRAQTVGVSCPNGNECTGTGETCNANTKCECATSYINPSSGTCIESDCTAFADCSTTKSILNSKCVSLVCVCDDLSETSTTVDAAFGSCIAKVCTANGGECGTTLNAVCDTTTDANNPVCACDSTFKLTEGSCTARVTGKACTTASAQCSGITNTYCISSTCACGPLYTGTPCAAKTCTKKSDCPTNALCSGGSCACGTIFTENSATGECETIACAANGGQCTGANTICDTTTHPNAPVCACDTTYTLTESACIARVIGSACTTASAQCSGITNAFCLSSVCACGPLYTGTPCVAKTCNQDSDCTTNAVCSSGSCACGTTFTENSATGACDAIAYGDPCSSDANCEDIHADAVCDTTATSSLCKIGSGKNCTGNTDKCVSNAACGSDSLCACNTGYGANTNSLCVSNSDSGAGAIVMYAGIMLMSVIILII